MYKYTKKFKGRSVPRLHRLLHLSRALLNLHICIRAIKSFKGECRTSSAKVVRFLNDLTNSTNGKGLDWLNLFVVKLRRSDTAKFDSYERNMITECGLSVTTDQYAQMINTLKSDGVIKISRFLSKKDAIDLEQQIRLIPGQTKKGELEWSSLDHWLNSTDNFPRFDTRDDLLAHNPTINRISCNHLLQAIARDYLGTPPLIVDIQSWTTTVQDNLSEQYLEEAAMAFHCDSDYIKFLKIFLLLTDVDDENGPFQFVLKSHRGNRHVAGRMPDSEIVTKSDTLFNGTGEAGDLIIVDTRGWHKAKPVEIGHRTLLQVIFTSSYFGGQVV
jgi:hypothetical protein